MTFAKLINQAALLLTVSNLQAQNLVVNPGFEDTLQCPYFVSQIDFAVNWHTSVNTPDYYNACNNNGSVNPGMVGVPYSARGYQPSRTGNAFAGVVIYWTAQTDYREIFYAQLLTPLVAGKKYHIGMYAILNEDNAMWAVDGGLGIYVSAQTINPFTPFAYTPQISNPAGNVLNDTLNWTEISGTYVAVGGEQYITIGSFIPDNMLTIINRGGSYPFTSYAIEDVWVYSDSITQEIIPYADNNEIIIYPNPSDGKFTLELPDEIISVALSDIAGKIIYTYRHPKVEKQICLYGILPGIYFARFNSRNHSMVVSKIIIQ